ncbi:MAG TPA: hypothetical protein DCX54_11450 [Flavobacteriales bacterium]|nr:hypothetical protein [Flavobacteriales bacterium]
MRKKALTQMNLRNYILTLGVIALIGISCGDGGNGTTEANGTEENTSDNSTGESNQLFEMEGKLFSIPSPVQTAFLIKEVGSNYDPTFLNDAKVATNYSTNFKKGINLGIYSADLGYVTIYEQTQDAIAYLTAVKKLANDLGVSGAFDMKLMSRFEGNLGNRDSLLCLVGDALRASDAYLKNNQRNDVGSLVLAGGWIESLYFSTLVAARSHNDDVINRIGSQKATCNNLVQLLMPYYSKEDYTALIDQLMELNDVYKGVEIVYTYKEPTVDVGKKKTTFNSVSDVRITDEQLNDISQKIKIIRDQLVS